MPERIQRRRTAGWRMPAGVVYVGRPTVWGNMFKVGGYYASRTSAWDRPEPLGPGAILGEFERLGFDGGTWTKVHAVVRDGAHAVELFRAYIAVENVGVWDPAEIREQLGGRDLACWCPPGDPCHADVLLAIANPDTPGKQDQQ